MKKRTKAILPKLGAILAAAMLFTMLAVPAWAEGEDTIPTGGGPNSAVSDPISSSQPTSVPTYHVPNDANKGVVPLADSDNPSSNPGSDSDSSGENPNPTGGTPYITAYTVLNSQGQEIQRVEAGQKCRIVISVVDPRITDASQLTVAKKEYSNGQYIDRIYALAANIKITSTGSFGTPSLGDISTTTFAAHKIDPNQGMSFAVILNDITYLGGDNKLSFDLSYNNEFLAIQSLTQAISQCVGAQESTGEAGALVITSTSYGGGEVEAGSDFTLTVDVLASKGTASIDNVQVALTLPEHITVTNGSSDIFLGDMKPNTSQQASFQLSASAVAPSGSQNISVTVTSTTEGAGASKTVVIPISQPERFEISRTSFPEYLSMGEEGYASVAFVNKGKGTIYNVSAEISGEGFTTTEGSQFVGNVASGTESSADFTIQTSESGTLTGMLTVTYEDEKGNEKTLTKDFSMTVEEMNMDPGMDPGFDPGFEPMPEDGAQGGMPVWGWILIGVGVVAAGVVVLIVLKKKKAKKRAAQLMEDDDEDI